MSTSKYPSSEVLKQISPYTSPGLPQAVPVKKVPSSSIRAAGPCPCLVVPFSSCSETSLNAVPFPKDPPQKTPRKTGALQAAKIQSASLVGLSVPPLKGSRNMVSASAPNHSAILQAEETAYSTTTPSSMVA